jgi:parallel beta-helix repeat protein
LNKLPRQTLSEIISQYGMSVCDNPQRCKGLLLDLCGAYHREVSILLNALETNVVADLRTSSGQIPSEVLIARMAERLYETLGIDRDFARWGVESWALALGSISSEMCKTESVTRKDAISESFSVKGEKQSNGSSQQILVVSKSGKGQFTTISDAIQCAPWKARILIQPGTYCETVIIDKQLEIVGDGPVEQIIIENKDTACLEMKTNQAIVRGLTLRGLPCSLGKQCYTVHIPQGHLELINCDITSNSLACIGIYSLAANPLIKNCKIHHGADCGIIAYKSAKGIIEECEIYNNIRAGIETREESDLTVRNCKIHHGGRDGVLVWRDSRSTLENCDIFNNRQAGIKIEERGHSSVRKCKIRNSTYSGILVQKLGKGSIENCSIFGNKQAGIDVQMTGNVTAKECYITDNTLEGIRAAKDTRGIIKNCIFVGNVAGDTRIDRGSQITIL